MKFIEDYIREKLHNIGVCSDFMATTTKPEATKSKIDMWDYIKLKHVHTAKETE